MPNPLYIYIYIEYIWFVLVGFYDISTFVGYLMPNHVLYVKNRKAARLDEIPPEVWKTSEFDDIPLRPSDAVYNQNTIDRWTTGCILPFSKKDDLGIAKNYRGITLTSIAAKIYNAQLCNTKLRSCFGRTKMDFGEIDPRHYKFFEF